MGQDLLEMDVRDRDVRVCKIIYYKDNVQSKALSKCMLLRLAAFADWEPSEHVCSEIVAYFTWLSVPRLLEADDSGKLNFPEYRHDVVQWALVSAIISLLLVNARFACRRRTRFSWGWG
jgi:hypothetical protein